MPSTLTDHAVPSVRMRLLCAAGTAAAFLLFYGLCNYVAQLRDVSRCFAFAWEYDIPRINWMILPYWCIDLLLAGSPLFTVRQDQLRLLLVRLAAILFVSCVFFLILPARCGYDRGIPEDWTGPLFQLLHLTDLPYNQAPSLHVSEAIVAGAVILPRFRGAPRLLMAGLMALGCAATVFVHQHHIIDLVTGALTGAAAMLLIRPRDRLLTESSLGGA